MKLAHLRIGNLIYYNGNKNELGLITAIESYIIKPKGFVKLNFRNDKTYDLDQINPIPLTKEWLFNFGFVHDTYGNFSLELNKDVFLVLYMNEIAKLQQFVSIAEHTISIKIEFIHQLQNLYFVLTETELTINKQ